MSLHLRARKKWEKPSIRKTGKTIQYLVVFKEVVNLSHSCGGIWCKLHQISKMPIKKKKAILRNLLIIVSFSNVLQFTIYCPIKLALIWLFIMLFYVFLKVRTISYLCRLKVGSELNPKRNV